MFLPHDNKDMVERPENEPKFNSKNKTDRTILILIIVGLAVTLTILGVLIWVYYAFLRG